MPCINRPIRGRNTLGIMHSAEGETFVTFEQMRYFLTLAQTLSFTETAKQTFTTQPTVSRQIKMLEQELGQPLFYRKGNSICLTSTGQLFYENLSEADKLIQESIHIAKTNVADYTGSLRVGSSISLDLEPFVVDCYKQFAAKYPRVQFSFVKAPVPELHAKVMKHEYDLILCHEYFHHLEWHEIGMTSRRHLVPMIKIGGISMGKTGVPSLSEIAANAFAQECFVNTWMKR